MILKFKITENLKITDTINQLFMSAIKAIWYATFDYCKSKL